MPNQTTPTLLCQNLLGKLASPLTLSNGTTVPAGTEVLFLPQTVADCVLLPDNEHSLAEEWENLSKTGHSHQEIIDLAAQMIRFSNRLSQIEVQLASNN